MSAPATTARRIDAPGIYDIPEAEYHADPAPEPSLSNSVAKVLLDQTPAHAQLLHPRLNPDREAKDPSREMCLGSAVHAMALGKGARVVEVPFGDYKKKEAQQQRDEAFVSGAIPLLSDDLERAHLIVDALRDQIASHRDLSRMHLFDHAHGRPEQAVVWREHLGKSSFWCRSLIDWLPNDRRMPIIDLKTSGVSVNPNTWSRQLFLMGYDTQQAMYPRGVRAVEGGSLRHMIFVVIERDPPFAMIAMDLSPMAKALADQRLDHAMMIWDRCRTTNHWPPYAPITHTAEAPAWFEAQWLEHRDNDRQADAEVRRLAFNGQRPLDAAE